MMTLPLAILSILSLAGGYSPPRYTVVRQDYGVVFSPQAILDNTHSIWQHTFAYKLHTEPLPDVTKFCGNNSRMLYRRQEPHNRRVFPQEDDFCPAFREYNEQIITLEQQIARMKDNFDLLLPESREIVKRGLIDIVGKVAKSLFGVATTEDTDIMAEQIQTIRNDQELVQDRISLVDKKLYSYMLQSTERQRLLERGLRLNKQLIKESNQRIRQELHNKGAQLRNWINILYLYGTQYLDNLAGILYHHTYYATCLTK